MLLLSSTDLSRYHLCTIAADLFLRKGFDAVTMKDIALAAGMTEPELFSRFGNKQDIILFLFGSINTDWQLYVEDLTATQLAGRFEEAMLYKIGLMRPFADLLANMMGMLLQHDKVGIHAAGTSHIRAQGLHTIAKILDGASDGKGLQKKIKGLAPMLYMIHWAILLLYVQSKNEEQARQSVKLAAGMLKKANNISFLMPLFPFFKDVGAWAGQLLSANEEPDAAIDKEIWNIILHYRKTSDPPARSKAAGKTEYPPAQLAAIAAFTRQQKPLHFILPAFPAKSPNHDKVLGTLPDLGEEIALMTLEGLCKEIRSVYAPGAYVTICSDGRIFSELVGVADETITAYVQRIREMITELSLGSVAIVNLEDLLEASSFETARQQVLDQYAEPLEELRKRAKSNETFTQLFNGIHRFITEDRLALFPEQSKTKIKEGAKQIALQVIQHSNAWTRFLAYVFPGAMRLSIHPYPAGSHKTGIRLTRAADNWLTPWHGVIVLQHQEYVLMKRSEAEALNATLVYKGDQPYYYTLTDQ